MGWCDWSWKKFYAIAKKCYDCMVVDEVYCNLYMLAADWHVWYRVIIIITMVGGGCGAGEMDTRMFRKLSAPTWRRHHENDSQKNNCSLLGGWEVDVELSRQSYGGRHWESSEWMMKMWMCLVLTARLQLVLNSWSSHSVLVLDDTRWHSCCFVQLQKLNSLTRTHFWLILQQKCCQLCTFKLCIYKSVNC